jgi:putative peptidoglycan lipid II flippase
MYQPQPGWGMFGFKLVVAVAVMSAVLLLGMHFMPAWDQGICWSASCAWGLVVAGVVAYFGMLLLLGFRLRDFQSQGLGLRFQP